MKTLFLFALALVAISSPARGQTPVDQIRSLRAQSNAAIARHDAHAVASFLDTRYQITVGSGDLNWAGRAAQWSAVFAKFPDVIYVRTPQSVKVSSSGTRAAEIGTWVGSWTTVDGRQQEGGEYAAHWERIGGVWKIRAELFVTLSCKGPACQ